MNKSFDFSFVRDLMNKYIEEYHIDVSRLLTEKGSYIFYMNGNDGTDFDYLCNDRVCEFGCFYSSSQMYAIKCFVCKSGSIEFIIYDEENPQEILGKEVETLDSFDSDTCGLFAGYLLGSFDYRDIFDAPIVSWILTDYIPIPVYVEDYDEVYDDWDSEEDDYDDCDSEDDD